ncbi:hypothetical protein L208DRAFT_1404995 [Tricholoma matsutake]|nr:hypothetical protein L208DRAFT_1404995 [Tricholoma matsutake 945]
MPRRPQHYPPKALGSERHTTRFQAHEQLLMGWILGPGDLDVSCTITTQHQPQMMMPMAPDPSATSNCS